VHFAPHKLVIRQICQEPTARILAKPLAVTGNLSTVKADTGEGELYLLGIINSRLTGFFWHTMFADFKTSFPQVTIFSLLISDFFPSWGLCSLTAMSKGIRERLLVFLRAHRVLTVAVCDGEDAPHAAALFYAVDEKLRFYVVTDPSSQHGMAMLSRGIVAGTVHRDEQQWHEIQGVQFCGVCRQVEGSERSKAWALYTARFPFMASGNLVLTGALARTAMWRIETEWMRLIDNRLGFGHKEEWQRHRRHSLEML